ncbi:MAG: hypothetical protein ACM3NQ_08780 [Bacteroidales bacterium]
MATYRPGILEQLAVHGIRPRPTTPPALVRAFLSDLYRYEIRALRARLLRGEFPEHEYIGRVLELKAKYPLLGIPIQLWMG